MFGNPTRYKKLGGFLLCHVIAGFVQVAAGLVSLLLSIRLWRYWDPRDTFEFTLQMLTFAGLVYSMIANLVWAFMAIGRDPGFVRAWQISVTGAALSAVLQVISHLVYGYPEQATFWENPVMDVLEMIAVPLFFVLITLYYARSARVRVYLGTEEYLERVLLAKKLGKRNKTHSPP